MARRKRASRFSGSPEQHKNSALRAFDRLVQRNSEQASLINSAKCTLALERLLDARSLYGSAVAEARYHHTPATARRTAEMEELDNAQLAAEDAVKKLVLKFKQRCIIKGK